MINHQAICIARLCSVLLEEKQMINDIFLLYLNLYLQCLHVKVKKFFLQSQCESYSGKKNIVKINFCTNGYCTDAVLWLIGNTLPMVCFHFQCIKNCFILSKNCNICNISDNCFKSSAYCLYIYFNHYIHNLMFWDIDLHFIIGCHFCSNNNTSLLPSYSYNPIIKNVNKLSLMFKSVLVKNVRYF